MPHYVENGTDEVVVCDFVAAKEDNLLSKTIRQYRFAVDEDIVHPEICVNYIEVEKEEQDVETVTLKSGFEVEVKSFDAEGQPIMKTTKKQFVPRKKSVWGYTKDVKAALIKAIEFIEEEQTAPASAANNENV
jgi:hypothetical protein